MSNFAWTTVEPRSASPPRRWPNCVSAVDRLSPDAVTVIDTRGNLLVRPRKASGEPGSDRPEVDLEYRQKMERDLVLKIGSTLELLLGEGKFRAGASVDVDFSSADQ